MRNRTNLSTKPVTLREAYNKIEKDFKPPKFRVPFNYYVDHDLNQKFRKLVAKKYGTLNRSITHAVNEAILLWITVNEK